MKIVIPLFVIFCAATALPTNSEKKIRDEVEIVPIDNKHKYGDQPIVDTGVVFSGGSPFSSSPFDGLLGNLEGIMNRMRQQMEFLLNRFPFRSSGNNTSDEIPELPVGLPAFPGFDNLDLGKGNTTSVTKVIDGHKVVINETEYKKEGDLGGAYFKVRVIDVKPDSTEESTTPRDTEEVNTKDREHVESSFENEIPKSKEIEGGLNFDNIETFDEIVDNTLPGQDEVDGGKTFDEMMVPRQSIDLSRDTYVNDLLADSGAPFNPDAEMVLPAQYKTYEKINIR